ncbi:hypothetical protein T265_09023 [Opisthorchis viverrini]|uniref:Uncharacterized protein n=1 Tax=Opisthorchis viverrini TaxID=6198 RepID=A0A074Z7D3_OPIVI|nr:hypothetical protein T265_09023 [Opisthorchis viverrini]KER23013.1 hypothetical protein T265_09023 [Opisthorchis viverrini]
MLGGVCVPAVLTQANLRRKKAGTINAGQLGNRVRTNTFIVVNSMRRLVIRQSRHVCDKFILLQATMSKCPCLISLLQTYSRYFRDGDFLLEDASCSGRKQARTKSASSAGRNAKMRAADVNSIFNGIQSSSKTVPRRSAELGSPSFHVAVRQPNSINCKGFTIVSPLQETACVRIWGRKQM